MAISIRSRIQTSMVGLSLGLCALFTALIFLMVYVIEDRIFVNQVKLEQTQFRALIKSGQQQQIQQWQPLNANIKRVNSRQALPSGIPKDKLSIIASERGIHEYFDDENALFISNVSTANKQSYFLVYDVKELLAVRDSKQVLFLIISAFTLAITLIAIFVARRLTNTTLAPVSRLSKALKDDDLDHTVLEMAQEFSEDEIGVLASSLVQSLEKVRASSQREYEFNRGVSHELRSPIQVAQSAIELLELQNISNKTQKPISRLKRSIAEMSDITEAFLWLASDRQISSKEECSIGDIQSTIDDIKSVYPDNTIVIQNQTPELPQYPMPRAVLSVIIRNLIRNAIIHGDSSAITMTLKTRVICIHNNTRAANNEKNSFGIGLNIIEGLCKRFMCELSTSTNSSNMAETKEFQSQIVFISS